MKRLTVVEWLMVLLILFGTLALLLAKEKKQVKYRRVIVLNEYLTVDQWGKKEYNMQILLSKPNPAGNSEPKQKPIHMPRKLERKKSNQPKLKDKSVFNYLDWIIEEVYINSAGKDSTILKIYRWVYVNGVLDSRREYLFPKLVWSDKKKYEQ